MQEDTEANVPPKKLDGLPTLVPETPAPWWLGMDAPMVYIAASTTGEWIGTTQADPSPLEPGVWLLPARSYLDQPPKAIKGQAAVRKADAWTLIDDLRGTTVYHTSTGEAQVWAQLGSLPSEYTTEAPGVFEQWKDGEWKVDQSAKEAAEREAATRKRTLLMQYAGTQIGALQDAVDLEMANDREVASLKTWKTYRVLLNRVDVSKSVPASDQWPTSPAPAMTDAWLKAQGAVDTSSAKSAAN